MVLLHRGTLEFLGLLRSANQVRHHHGAGLYNRFANRMSLFLFCNEERYFVGGFKDRLHRRLEPVPSQGTLRHEASFLASEHVFRIVLMSRMGAGEVGF